MMRQYALESMKIDHYDGIFALWSSTPGISLSAADTRENIEAYLHRNPEQSFVCKHDGWLVGSILCGNDGRRAFVYHLAVDEAHRGQGIAAQLLDRAIEAQMALHIDKCALFVLRENLNAISFWEHAGFAMVQEAATMAKVIVKDSEG